VNQTGNHSANENGGAKLYRVGLSGDKVREGQPVNHQRNLVVGRYLAIHRLTPCRDPAAGPLEWKNEAGKTLKELDELSM
jgi:hypothetical protein